MRLCRPVLAVLAISLASPCFAETSEPIRVNNPPAQQNAFIDLLALMSGHCKTFKVAGSPFACKTVAYAHGDKGRVNFAVAVDDPSDDSHVVSFSGENGKRADDNSYELPIDRMLLNSQDRPRVDGLPVPTKKAGYDVTIPGYFQPRTNDFSAQIAEFKKNNCEIVGGITYPDDLKTFVTQCNQQGFKPKAVTVAAALLFPSGVEAMGPLGNGMSSEVWWTPAFPFPSTLTGQVSRDLADQWEKDQKRQWTQPLGYSHALLEVVIDVLKRSTDPLDREANRVSLAATDINTVVGPIKFAGKPHKNVSTTPIFGGQWVKGEKWMYDLKIVDNTVNKLFEPEQKIVAISW